MTNRKDSELTSITGANLADGDLFRVVDISDTTMAASGTNKKITKAELASVMGGADPSTLSRWSSYVDLVSGIASGVQAETGLDWTDEEAVVGTDISTFGLDPRYVTVSTDGVYAVTMGLTALTDSGLFTSADGQLGFGGPQGYQNLGGAVGGDFWHGLWAWTGFMPASDGPAQIAPAFVAGTDGGTYSVLNWRLWVQRLA